MPPPHGPARPGRSRRRTRTLTYPSGWIGSVSRLPKARASTRPSPCSVSVPSVPFDRRLPHRPAQIVRRRGRDGGSRPGARAPRPGDRTGRIPRPRPRCRGLMRRKIRVDRERIAEQEAERVDPVHAGLVDQELRHRSGNRAGGRDRRRAPGRPPASSGRSPVKRGPDPARVERRPDRAIPGHEAEVLVDDEGRARRLGLRRDGRGLAAGLGRRAFWQITVGTPRRTGQCGWTPRVRPAAR